MRATPSAGTIGRSGPAPARQRGFTLLELMVSLAIGFAVTAGAFSLHVSTLDVRRAIESRIALHEARYFSAQLVRRHVLQAGHRPLRTAQVDDVLLPFDDAATLFEAVAADGDDPGWAAGQYLRALDDGFAIRYAGASDAAGDADGTISDCAGNAVADDANGASAFRLVSGRLRCESGADDVVLAGDATGDVRVEDMVVRVGLDDDGDASADRTEALSDWTPGGASVPVALEVRLLFAGADRVLGAPEPYRFDGVETTPTDTRERRESVVAVALRNRP